MTHRESRAAGFGHITTMRQDRVFYAVVNAILFLFALLVLAPILNVFANSFSSSEAVAAGRVTFWPVDFSLDGYRAVFQDKYILSGYKNTILYTALGTAINLFMTVLCAYPLSRGDLVGRNFLMFIFSFTMIFSGGMIPSYLLVRNLNMIDKIWAMVLPGAISVYNMIICRTFFQTTIARELHEAAQLDGCSDFRFLLSIVLPLSRAVIAVIGLYYAVGHWNSFFNAFLYLNKRDLYPLQIVLRDILVANTVDPALVYDTNAATLDLYLVEVLKYALIIVSCLPIWCLYPLVQKHFVQGAMIGAIKG
ncbi:carbohydrate ABC transporter permease [Eubacteriales bacterium OttesenSCG-928-A19]|nr:carbohydrate ABC transporter permease [Eubacteriales bacterium OttesenSCG-928-A19]